MQIPLQYVVLRHENIDAPHFDLMFETTPGGALATWRSDVWPLAERTPLLHLADHRREYLNYEGPLTGDRGSVRRIEAGTFVGEVSLSFQAIVELRIEGETSTIAFMLDTARGEPHWMAHRRERSQALR